MSAEPARASSAPDRVLARAAAVVLGAGLAAATLSHLMLDRAMRAQDSAAALALAGDDEAAAARAVVAGLERVAAPAEDAADRATRSRLAWDLDRLVAQEDRRLALAGASGEGSGSESSDLLRAVAEAREIALGADPDRGVAAELAGAFAGQVLPQLDLIATRHRAEVDRARHAGRLVLAASLAAHLLGGTLLLAAVVLPAWRRVAAWVAASREAEREQRFRLLHDPLTGLPNATYLEACLARLAAGGRRAGQTAVLRLDFDRFRVLRDTLGQGACDEIARLSGQRIRNALRAGDFAAYLGGDGFVVVAPELADGNDAAGIVARIQTALAKPFSLRGGPRRLTCGVGVTLVSDDRAEPERILANAGIALAEAQRAGPGSVRYFRESLRIAVEERETLFAELVAGLDRHQLVPFFQPQVDLATGGFSGFESLVRWEHPRHGLLAPASFLDFAEQTDLAERIGEVVLTRSFEAIRAWDAAGVAVPRVGINFALAQLRDPRLIEKIKWEAERFDVDPGRIAIEVLETVLIKSDTDMVVRNLRGLASAGFHVELDDFGTGHASIANLRRFAVSRIKIDGSFIAGIETCAEQQKLTASMIAMAHALGIGTLAEGVETAAAAAMLRRLGCDFLQGFFVAEAMPLGETLSWLKARGTGGTPLFNPSDPVPVDPNMP